MYFYIFMGLYLKLQSELCCCLLHINAKWHHVSMHCVMEVDETDAEVFTDDTAVRQDNDTQLIFKCQFKALEVHELHSRNSPLAPSVS